jgi:hypothetical protein
MQNEKKSTGKKRQRGVEANAGPEVVAKASLLANGTLKLTNGPKGSNGAALLHDTQQKLLMAQDARFPEGAVPQHACRPISQPVSRHKVDGLHANALFALGSTFMLAVQLFTIVCFLLFFNVVSVDCWRLRLPVPAKRQLRSQPLTPKKAVEKMFRTRS